MSEKKAQKGNKVKIEYTGTFDDGVVFDASEKHGKPLEFEVGSGQVIPGFDQAVEGMQVGEEKDVRIEAKDAYGEYNPQMVQEMPKEKLGVPEVKKDMVLAMTLPNGAQLPVRVVEVTDDMVKLDVNHPLAGKALNFKIKLVGIEDKE